METWTEVGRVKPRPAMYRTVCAVPGCTENADPVPFVTRDSAEAWARNHADLTQHVVLIQAATA